MKQFLNQRLKSRSLWTAAFRALLYYNSKQLYNNKLVFYNISILMGEILI